MRKKVMAIIFLGLIMIFLNPASVESYNNEGDLLRDAFKLSQAHFSNIKIVSWAKFNKKNEAQEATDLLKKVLDKEKISNQSIAFKISPVLNDGYVVGEIQSDKIDINSTELKQKINNTYARQEEKVYLATIYSGYYNGQLKKEQMSDIGAKIFRALETKKIESYTDENYFMSSGNTPHIKNFLMTEDKKVNINVAFRYNNLEKKTYFYIGTPIISIEY